MLCDQQQVILALLERGGRELAMAAAANESLQSVKGVSTCSTRRLCTTARAFT